MSDEEQLDRLRTALADRYRVEQEVGQGGMATVYLAEDRKNERPVAIKVLRPEIAAALGAERFLREIKLTARIDHPHILPLYDSGETDGLLYYIMPYVEGETLRDRLNREKQLSIEDAIRITTEVADALEYAHQHDVIHRDIKPENILLSDHHARVADFGIARAISAAGGERLTETGVVVGTAEYMSPEQAGGERDVDGRSDVYALGCVLYEMLGGQPPFTGATVESIVHQQLTAAPPRITVLRPSVPERVARALERSLAKTPADRFYPVTFAEAISALGGVTPQDTPHPKPVGTRRQRRLRLGVAVAVVAIAVLGTVFLLPGRAAPALDRDRVLVVAFADESGPEGFPTLGRMAQDYIIQVLTEAGFVEVVDPLTALAVSQNVAAGGTSAQLGHIVALANEAEAGTVVSGSYYAEGDSLHVQARISDARNGRLLGTVGPVVGAIGAPSALVARLGEEVVAALAPLLDRALGSWEPAVQPATYEAYEAYDAGVEAYARGGEWEVPEAARQFERAVAADPTFFRARLWAAQTYFVMSYWGGSPDLAFYAKAESLLAPLLESPGQLTRYERCRLDFVTAWGLRLNFAAAYEAAGCMTRAAPGSDDARREAALFAVRVNRPGEAIELLRELDPDRGLMKHWGFEYWLWLSGAYHMLGDYEGELGVAREWRQRFPTKQEANLAEGRALAALGRVDDVEAILETMRSLPSLATSGAWPLGQVAQELRAHGDLDAASEAFDQVIAWYQSRASDGAQMQAQLARWLYEAQRWGDAARLFEQLAEVDPNDSEHLAWLGRVAARRGNREEALRISDELGSFAHPLVERNRSLYRARIAALLGHREEAVTLLQRAIEQGAQWGHGWGWHADIDFEPLRDYPPFQEFLRPKG